MSDNLPTEGLILHIWPNQWGLVSFDPLCLAAALYLQLTIPGKFSIVETSNPDTSPTGQLPYLVHEQYIVASYPSIVKYVSDLRNAEHTQYPNGNLDIHLTAFQKAQRTAWSAHAESHLGDLVYHALYSMEDNWVKMTGPSLASMFPVPQKYYVPRRIRVAHLPKLAAVGLWTMPIEEKPVVKPFQKDKSPLEKEGLKKNSTVAQAFERQKVLDKARVELDIYNELLEGKDFLFQDHPSSVDLLIASHVFLLLDPPYPNSLLQTLIYDTYPTLVSHARRINDLAFGDERPNIRTGGSEFSPWALLPSWPQRPKIRKAPTLEEAHFNHMRWGFFGLAVGSLMAYLAIVGSQVVVIQRSPLKRIQAEDDDDE